MFKLGPTGAERVLHTFMGTDGANPNAGVIRDSAGNLYSTTTRGGANGTGAVFKLDLAGSETVLYSFRGKPRGFEPYAGLIRDSAGNLYGTTSFGGFTGGECKSTGGCGVIFKLKP